MTTHAVVIRHDVPDAKYVVPGKDFPALVDLPEEDHGVLIAKQWVVTAAHATMDMQTIPQHDNYVVIDGKRREVSKIVRYPDYMVFSITFLIASPTMPVSTVAQTIRTATRLNASTVAKYVCLHCFQKYAITANIVPVCSITSSSVICGDEGSSPISFSATTTCAELDTGSSSASPCTTARITTR